MPAGVYLGDARRRWQFSRVLLTETTYEGSARLELHAHERAHLCIVLDGCYEETVGRGTDVRTPGMALYLPAGWAHAEHHHRGGM